MVDQVECDWRRRQGWGVEKKGTENRYMTTPRSVSDEFEIGNWRLDDTFPRACIYISKVKEDRWRRPELKARWKKSMAPD